MTGLGALFILVLVGLGFYYWDNPGGGSYNPPPPPPPSNDPPVNFNRPPSRHEMRDSHGKYLGYLYCLPTRTQAFGASGGYLGYYCETSDQTFDKSGHLVGYGNLLSSLFL